MTSFIAFPIQCPSFCPWYFFPLCLLSFPQQTRCFPLLTTIGIFLAKQPSGRYYKNLSPLIWSLVSIPQDDDLVGFKPDECIENIHINQWYLLPAALWMHILIWNLSEILVALPLLGDMAKLLLRLNLKFSYWIIFNCCDFIISALNLQVKDKKMI